jgi:predicted transcriptional regulator
MSEEKEAIRKLIMLISDLRAKDEERYEAHVNFMNETIKMISAIESQMNKHWSTVLESLKELNEDINNNLDSLLTGMRNV